MIRRANEEGKTVAEIAEKYIREYYVDAHGLGIKDPTYAPRATENIDAIIDMIKTLVDKGYAYVVDGDVYFKTSKFEEYGKLSGHRLEDLELGARIEVDERKENAMDFACGRPKNRVSLRGTVRGGRADRGGILSVRQWPTVISVKLSIYTAAVRT